MLNNKPRKRNFFKSLYHFWNFLHSYHFSEFQIITKSFQKLYWSHTRAKCLKFNFFSICSSLLIPKWDWVNIKSRESLSLKLNFCLIDAFEAKRAFNRLLIVDNSIKSLTRFLPTLEFLFLLLAPRVLYPIKNWTTASDAFR